MHAAFKNIVVLPLPIVVVAKISEEGMVLGQVIEVKWRSSQCRIEVGKVTIHMHWKEAFIQAEVIVVFVVDVVHTIKYVVKGLH